MFMLGDIDADTMSMFQRAVNAARERVVKSMTRMKRHRNAPRERYIVVHDAHDHDSPPIDVLTEDDVETLVYSQRIKNYFKEKAKVLTERKEKKRRIIVFDDDDD